MPTATAPSTQVVGRNDDPRDVPTNAMTAAATLSIARTGTSHQANRGRYIAGTRAVSEAARRGPNAGRASRISAINAPTNQPANRVRKLTWIALRDKAEPTE